MKPKKALFSSSFFLVLLFTPLYAFSKKPQGPPPQSPSPYSLHVGGLYIYSPSPYKFEDKRDHNLVPFFSLTYKNWEFQGLNLNYYFHRSRTSSFKFTSEYKLKTFEPEKESGLEERGSSYFYGGDFQYNTPSFQVKLKASIGGNQITPENFFQTSLTLSRTHIFPPSFITSFSLGLKYYNSDYNDFLFGVSEQEAQQSSLSAYKLKGNFFPTLGVNFIYKKPLSPWSFIFIAERLFYTSSEIEESPLLKSKTGRTTALFIIQRKI